MSSSSGSKKNTTKQSKPRIENVVRTAIEAAMDHNKFATRDYSLLAACLLIVEALPSSETSVNVYHIT